MANQNSYEISALVNMTIIKKTKNKSWERCGEKGMHTHYWSQCKSIYLLWKTEWKFLN